MNNNIENLTYEEDYTALKEFLLDIDCLDPLDEWLTNFIFFDILKITRTEIRHSNILSWLLDPSENHGLGDKLLKGIIQFIVSCYYSEDDLFDTLLMDCHDFIIQREWHHIDILAVSHSQRFVICIEIRLILVSMMISLQDIGLLLNKCIPITEKCIFSYLLMIEILANQKHGPLWDIRTYWIYWTAHVIKSNLCLKHSC